ncbi:MAG: hypothetical protein R6U85_11740 [Salinivirgaceae bacterium]
MSTTQQSLPADDLEAYDNALEKDNEHLNADQRTMVIAQKSLLKADHDHVKALRNSLV